MAGIVRRTTVSCPLARTAMLHCDLHVSGTPAAGAPLFVLLHGRGATERDLLGLRPQLPDGALLALPRAPFPGASWGYGGGWAWYRYLGGSRVDEASFSDSQAALAELLEELPTRLPAAPGPLVLGGFSQGGTMALAHALLHPGAVPHVLNFSGFLAEHPAVRAEPATVRGTRIWWGHGVQDPAIPFARAVEGRAVLRAAGADLETRDYPIGHWIDDGELRDALAWLDAGGTG